MRLYKTTIVIISDFDTDFTDIEYLAREANCGDAYLYRRSCIDVNPDHLDREAVDFFNCEDEEV